MAKRYTDNEIWKNQRWFRKLKPDYKLAFCYIKDVCNHAGLWKIDCPDLIEDLGLSSFSLPKFVEEVNSDFDKITGEKILKERILIINEKFIWLTQFIQFEYEGKDKKINWKVPAIKSAFVLLEGLGTLTKGIEKGFITLNYPLEIGWQTYRDKDKDKERIGGTGERKTMKGVRYSDDKKTIYFEDGSFQELGEQQTIAAKNEKYKKPHLVTKGSIY
jgi:hypothetical protein